MDIRVIRLNEPERARYDAFFESCPGAFIQQSSWWAEVIAGIGPDLPLFLLAEHAGVPTAALPLYLLQRPQGNVLTSVPQAGPLGGVFVRPGLDARTVTMAYTALLDAAVALARRHECLALSCITHPFANDLALYQAHLQPDYVFENFTQYIEVREHFGPAGEVRLADYNRRSNLSRNLAKARRAGFRVRFCDNEAEVDELHRIHLKRHAEIGAVPMDPRMLRNIVRYLVPRNKAFIVVLESDAGVASWAVYILHRDVLDVLRLNMDSSQAAACPNFLTTDVSLAEARRRGVLCYNWQSAPARASGVYRFKQQWGSVESTYHYVTKLFCPHAYLAELGLEVLRRDYPLHFIAPYAAAAAGFTPGFYRKE